MMTREEMMTMVRAFDSAEGHSCEGCPLAGHCEALELFWGCEVWEEGMGGRPLNLLKEILKRG